MNERGDDTLAVLVFARAPEPGHAKTRLIPALGREGAARLQAAMTLRAVAAASEAAVGEVQIWCTPTADDPFFARCTKGRGLTLYTQQGTDLGARLRHGHDTAFEHYPGVLIMGTDCPLLTANELRAAARDIARHDAVIIPAEDGGYVLLGLSRACPNAFRDIAWGTEQVYEQTIERLREAGCTRAVHPPLWDIDRPEDLPRLRSLLPQLLEEVDSEPSVDSRPL